MLSLMEIGYLEFEGNRLGYVYFLLFSAILFFKIVLNEEQMKISKSKVDDLLMEMELSKFTQYYSINHFPVFD